MFNKFPSEDTTGYKNDILSILTIGFWILATSDTNSKRNKLTSSSKS